MARNGKPKHFKDFSEVISKPDILPEDKNWKDLRDEDCLRRALNITPLNKNQEKFIKSVYTNILTIAMGRSGVGRTYLSCALACKLLIEGKVSKIVLTRPIVSCGGEALGFLPGDSWQKIEPYMRILVDYMEEFLGEKEVKRLTDEKQILFIPIGEMRGKNFVDSAVVVDEAQNLNKIQIEMLLTRISSNCIMIINADPMQSDLYRGSSEFMDTVKKLYPLKDEIGFIEFTKEDVVRSGLVRKIVELLY